MFDGSWTWKEFGLLALAGAGAGAVWILTMNAHRLTGGSFLFNNVMNGAFAGVQPGAAVSIPHGYDPSKPLDLALYFHGWNNCVRNMVGEENSDLGVDGYYEYFDHALGHYVPHTWETVVLPGEGQDDYNHFLIVVEACLAL